MEGHSTYQPASGFTRWLDRRLPILRLAHDSFVAYPTPRNLNYWWTFGAMLALCLVVQIVTGIVLAMHYTPNIGLAFDSVQRIKRDVSGGWLIQSIHAVGASMFFVAVFIHMLRGLYYGSYKPPRELLWILGCIIYLLMIITAFLGYTLPWGQMSFWGATVITNLLGALPLIGDPIHTWIVGAGAIDNPTLNRFFSLHYLFPFLIAGVVVLHIWALHEAGQNNPTGVEPKTKADTVPFTPHATIKDLFATSIFMILFAVFVFFMPDVLGDPQNFIKANPMVTPPEIAPEWYLRSYYAILRAIDFNVGPIDSKLAGVILMFGAIAILFVLPWLDTSKVRSMRYRPIARQFFLIFVVVNIGLGWCGGQSPATQLMRLAPYKATLSWMEGSQTAQRQLTASSAAEMPGMMQEATAQARQQGASMVFMERQGGTHATMMTAAGGARQSVQVTAADLSALEEAIGARKAQIGSRAPFFEIVREEPFVFTVTMLSQLLTAYYFLFFLVILPVLGLRETPSRVPDTIAKPVVAPQGAS